MKETDATNSSNNDAITLDCESRVVDTPLIIYLDTLTLRGLLVLIFQTLNQEIWISAAAVESPWMLEFFTILGCLEIIFFRTLDSSSFPF